MQRSGEAEGGANGRGTKTKCSYVIMTVSITYERSMILCSVLGSPAQTKDGVGHVDKRTDGNLRWVGNSVVNDRKPRNPVRRFVNIGCSFIYTGASSSVQPRYSFRLFVGPWRISFNFTAYSYSPVVCSSSSVFLTVHLFDSSFPPFLRPSVHLYVHPTVHC